MNAYLVGGAVRDQLLGRPVTDRDWVVVGATPEQMIEQGFRPVGKDFPVFLHPRTHEEYALARTERKTAPGYHGFAVHADPDVTLEEDLARRDLTINAMAMDADGTLIDPFSGLADLENRVLRHVSDAFREDPVRILRGARFAARFAADGFIIAPETMALMRRMVDAGEVDALVAERVWQELKRALAEPSPQSFIQVLRACGALRVLLPEVDALYGIPQPSEHHPEVDTGLHIELCLRQAARLAPGDAEVAYAVLLHDLGKAVTPMEEWPAHHRHESAGRPLVRAVSERLACPRSYRELAELTCAHHLRVHQADGFGARALYRLLLAADALRRPDRFAKLLLACEADARGRTGLEARPYPAAARLAQALSVSRAADLTEVKARKLKGEAMKQAVDRARRQAIAAAIED